MKKICIWSIVLFFIHINASEIIINNNDSDIQISSENRSIYVQVNRVNVDYEGNWANVSINGADFTTEAGSPRLPVINRFIYAQNAHDITVVPGNVSTYSLKGNDVSFCRPSVFKGGKEPVTEKNEHIYGADMFYPQNDYDIIDAGYSMGRRMFLVRLYPVKYNPLKNSMNIITAFQIHNSSIDTDRFKQIPSQYLIVMPPHSSPYIDSFIMLKKREGYIVNVLHTDTAGQTSESIKSYIQKVYDNSLFPLSYILLIGDTEHIPNFTGTELNAPPTDLYYSTLAGSDYFPDAFVGRISVNDSFELDTVLKKIIRTQSSSWQSGDSWVNRAYLMATNDATFHTLAEGTQNYAASQLRTLPMTVDSLYYYYNTGTPLADAVNNGRALLLYTGHGTETSWSGPTFSQAAINSLNNSDMNPAIFSFACLTGDYAHTAECFGETWLKKSTGASVFVGSSVTSLWFEDDVMERTLVKAITDSTRRDIGYLLDISKKGVYAAYSGDGYSKRYFEMYNILGDPSMNLNTDIQGALTINTNSIISDYADSIRIYVSCGDIPVEYASVSIVMDDALVRSGITDKNGYVSLYNALSSGDSADIYAFKHNHRYGHSYVLCNGSNYADISSILINDKNTLIGDPDSILSAGDSGWIKLKVINYGNDTITDMNAMYDFSSPYIIQYDSLMNIADTIYPGDTVISTDSMQFSVTDTVPYGSVAHIYIALIGDSIFNEFDFYRAVSAPLMTYTGYDIAGKKTNEVSSGDTLSMLIKIENSGNMTDEHVTVYIVPDDSLMTVQNDTITIDIAQTDTVYSDTITCIISPAITDFSVLSFGIFIRDTLGNLFSHRDSVFVNTLDYLVLDYDMNHNSGPVIDSILSGLGYNGHYRESIKRNELYNYRNIFMCRGVYPNAVLLTPTDSIANLIDTLLAEGTVNLYMEGGECWYYDVHVSGGYSFNDAFGLEGISDGAGISSLLGLDQIIANSMTFIYSGDNSYLDRMDAQSGTALFSDGTHIMGVYNKTADYRTVGLSFELGGLEDDVPPSTKENLLQNIMDYFNGLTGTISNESINKMHISFSILSSNQCEFFISGPLGDNVSINIYDVSGRMIISEHLHIDRASGIRWSPDTYAEFASGIYFIRAVSSSGDFAKGKFIIVH